MSEKLRQTYSCEREKTRPIQREKERERETQTKGGKEISEGKRESERERETQLCPH